MVKRIISLSIVVLLLLVLITTSISKLIIVTAKDDYKSSLLGTTPITYDNGYQAVEGYTLPEGITSVATSVTDTTNKFYSWALYDDNQVIKSGNAGMNNSISVLQIKVTGIGVLNFEYRVYAPDLKVISTSNSSEENPDSFLISVGTEITKATNYDDAGIERHYGYTGWLSKSISIEPENDNVVTTVYLAYKKNGSKSDSVDLTLIRNLNFNKSNVTVNGVSSNSTYGEVTGSQTILSSKNVTLVATPKNGGTFYGWSEDGKVIDCTDLSYTFAAGKDRTVTAIFGNSETVIAQNVKSGFVYDTLSEAFSNAKTGEDILLVKDTTLSSNVTIPTGITLQIPYSSTYDKDGNGDGDSSCSANNFAGIDKTYRKLTINNGVTLTVNGTLLIGGIIGYPTQQYQGHTSSYHGRVTNNGTISVDGGKIECYGFIDGAGIVSATNSGKVYEPFIVFDFAGGSNCANLYFIDQSSFTQYTMQNISCTLEINYGSYLYAYCNLYASSEFNKTIAKIVGVLSDGTSTLYGLKEGSKFVRTVDKTKSIKNATSVGGDYGSDIYRVTTHIYGGSSLNNLQMEVYGINISVANFTIPYCSEIILGNGTYNINIGWILYPGSTFKIEEDAIFDLNGRLYALEGLYSTGLSGKYYPNASQLQAAGFTAGANFIVNGRFNINEGSTFGGVVQTTGTSGEIYVNKNAIVTTEALQIGGTACYDDNTNVMKLDGRVMIDGELTILKQNRRYASSNTTSWVKESYTINKYVVSKSATEPTSGEYAKIPSGGSTPYAIYGGPKVVTINEVMYGSFSLPDELITSITVIKQTYYSSTDNTRVDVSNVESNKDVLEFTLSTTTGNGMYKHIVEYKVDDGEYIDISNGVGLYHLEDLEGAVTIRITSGLKGDIDLDGTITSSDVTILRRYLANAISITDKYKLYFADIDCDGSITSADVTLLRRFLANAISEL